MFRIPYPICAFAGLLLLVAMGSSLHDSTSATASMTVSPGTSVKSIRELLEAGLGSRYETGAFDFFSSDPLHPVAWLYVTDSTADGDGTEYLITTSSYVIPGPLATSVALTTRYLGSGASSLQEMLDDIVASYDHVDSTEDLEIVVRDVSPVQP
ncbi:MAG: hypothetical protein KDB73_11290 [Planctomycetes bacterium]|nr:hypothetical protein [Planctomycetota bacterium]